MSRFGEWKAYGQIGDFGRHVVLNIGREVEANRFEIVTALDQSGTVVKSEVVAPEESVTWNPNGVKIPYDLAPVIYQALHRMYGHENQDGKVDALEAALKVEQARVEKVIAKALS